MALVDGQKRTDGQTLSNSTDGKLFYVDYYAKMDLLAYLNFVVSKIPYSVENIACSFIYL